MKSLVLVLITTILFSLELTSQVLGISNNGNYFAFREKSKVFLSNKENLVICPILSTNKIGFTPDEKHFYYATEGDTVKIFNCATGQFVKQMKVVRTYDFKLDNDLKRYAFSKNKLVDVSRTDKNHQYIQYQIYCIYNDNDSQPIEIQTESNVDCCFEQNLMYSRWKKENYLIDLTNPQNKIPIKIKGATKNAINPQTGNIIIGTEKKNAVELDKNGIQVNLYAKDYCEEFTYAVNGWFLYQEENKAPAILNNIDGANFKTECDIAFLSANNSSAIYTFSNRIEYFDLQTRSIEKTIYLSEIKEELKNARFFANENQQKLSTLQTRLVFDELKKNNASGGKAVISDKSGKPDLALQTGGLRGARNIKYSPDGKYIAYTSGKEIVLTDAQSRFQLKKYKEHQEVINCIAFSGDGKILASGSGSLNENCRVIVREVESGKVLADLKKLPADIEGLALNKDGSLLAYNHRQGGVMVWDINKNRTKSYIDAHKGTVEFIAFSPDSKYLYTCVNNFKPAMEEGDREIKVFSIQSSMCVKTLDTYYHKIRQVVFDENDAIAASLSTDGKVDLWDLEHGERYLSLNFYNFDRSFNESLFITLSKNRYIAVSSVKKVIIYDKNYEKICGSYDLSGYSRLAFSPEEKELYLGTYNYQSDIGEENVVDLTNYEIEPYQTINANWAKDLKYINKDSLLVLYEDAIRIWNLEKAEITGSYPGFDEGVLCFDIKNNLLAIGGHSGEVQIVDIKSHKTIASYTCGDYETESVKFTPDGKTLFAANNNKWISYYDIENKTFQSFTQQTRAIVGLDINKDGTLLAGCGPINTGFEGIINIWEIKTKRKLSSVIVPGGWVNKITFSPDGTKLCTGGWDNTTRIWSVPELYNYGVIDTLSDDISSVSYSNDGNYIAYSSVHNEFVVRKTNSRELVLKLTNIRASFVRFSSDNKYLFVGSNEIKMYNLETKTLVASLVSLKNNNFLAYTPDYYYKASKGSTKALAFIYDSKAFPFEQFDMNLNRPHVVMERIGYADKKLTEVNKKAYLKRLKSNNITEKEFGDKIHLPVIELVSESIPRSTGKKIVTLPFYAYDDLYTLKNIHVTINNCPVFGSKGLSVDKNNSQTIEDSVKVELVSGMNNISIYATNSAGSNSLTKSWNIKYTGESVKPNLYVFTIGVSDFTTNEYDLKYAAKDANDIIGLFENGKSAYNQVHVINLNNEKATRENIFRESEKLKNSRPEDYVVMFVASHGLLDNNLEYYIATHDVDFNDPAKRGLKYEEIEGMLDGIAARKKILLIDACHAGELDSEAELVADNTSGIQTKVNSRGFKTFKKQEEAVSMDNAFDLMKNMFNDLRIGSGTIVISSASGKEYALESDEYQNGVFTYALLSSIKNNQADLNKDGKIFISEIQNQVYDMVVSLTKGKQNPTTRKEIMGMDFELPVK